MCVFTCVYIHVCACAKTNVCGVRGQLSGVSSFLVPSGFWDLNPGHQTSGQAPYPLSHLVFCPPPFQERVSRGPG